MLKRIDQKYFLPYTWVKSFLHFYYCQSSLVHIKILHTIKRKYTFKAIYFFVKNFLLALK